MWHESARLPSESCTQAANETDSRPAVSQAHAVGNALAEYYGVQGMSESHAETGHLWPDAWLLLAIGCRLSHEEVSLVELIATADGIQHLVPTFDEVDGGLARLSRAGLVKLDGPCVRLTPPGLDLLSRTASPRKPLLAWQEDLERELRAAPWSRSYDPADARRGPRLSPGITREDYDVALRRSGRQPV